jgi:hypothetical protein
MVSKALACDLLLCRFQLVSLLCRWIVGVVGGRGLLHQYPSAGALKGRLASKTEIAGARERFFCDGKRCWVLECRAENGVGERERERGSYN